MKAKNKMYFMKTLSAVLAASMAASVFTAVPVYAETSSATYTYDGYRVDYTVINEWFGNQNVNVTLTNTSSESILNWALGYDATGEISGIWNGYVYSKSDEDYIIKNAGYNYEIEPYQSVNFGYTLSGDELEAPEKFELCSKRVDKTEGYDVNLNVTGDWGDSFQAELIVTNTSDAPLEAWKLDFDSNFEITNLWNGKIIESNDDGYSIASCMWTNPIASGESTSIGFTASKETSETPAVSNIKLSEVIIDRSGSVSPDEPVKPSEYELNITADAQYIENDGTAVISWNTSVNNGTFEIMYSEDNIEYIQVASVSDAKTYTYALGDIYGTVYFKVRQTTEGGQVAESSALSVDIPVPVVPEKPVVTLSAEYDKETGYVNVLWETTVEGGNFDIYVSVDSGEFEKKASVSDTVSYSFAPEVSGSYDIKIVQTTAAGMTGESSVVNVVCTIPDPAEDIDWEDETDSDEDGISDVYETYICFTDPHNPDTDSDGLPDGYEVFTLDTDPLSSDTDVNGVSDGDEDIDGDGLNNLREFELGTDPNNIDTDSDGLSDNDEVSKYKTDPLKYDTDEDGISDGDEVALGLDPTSASTDGTPDSERTFVQHIGADSENLSAVNTDENPFKVSIDITAAGIAANNLSSRESGYSNAIKNDAILGISPEFVYTDGLKVEDVVINFDIKASAVNNTNGKYTSLSDEFVGIKRLNVFKFFEDTNMLLPIETFHDVESGRVYTHVDELGTYCLMDMEVWLEGLDITSEENVSNEIAPVLYSARTYSVDEENNEEEQKCLDVVLVAYPNKSLLDTTKSDLKITCKSIFEQAEKENIDARIYFVSFLGSSIETPDGNIYACNYEEAEEIINRHAGITAALDEKSYALYKALNYSANNCVPQFRENSDRFCFVIDVCGYPRVDSGIGAIATFNENNVRLCFSYNANNINALNYSLLSSGACEEAVIGGGRYNFEDFIIKEIFGEHENEYPIISAVGWKRINLDEPITEEYFTRSIAIDNDPSLRDGIINLNKYADTDKDGLLDLEEIMFRNEDGKDLISFDSNGNAVLPNFEDCTGALPQNRNLFYVKNGLTRYADVAKFQDLYKLRILPIKSDPIEPDGDFDGLSDSIDISPCNSIIKANLLHIDTGKKVEYNKENDNNSTSDYSNKDKNDTEYNVEIPMDFSCFFNENNQFEHGIADMSIIFSGLAYSQYGSYLDKDNMKTNDYYAIEFEGILGIMNLTEAMEALGFTDVVECDLRNDYSDNHVAHFYFGHKKVKYNNKEKEIISVFIRGTTGVKEWTSNFDIGKSNDDRFINERLDLDNHLGFDVAAYRIYNQLDTYIKEHNLDSADNAYWITGHSRGAAIANLISAKLIDDSKNVYAYTYATPNNVVKPLECVESYTGIYNVVNKEDFVPALPLNDSWGFYKYGKSYELELSSLNKKKWFNNMNRIYASAEDFQPILKIFQSLANNRDECYQIFDSSLTIIRFSDSNEVDEFNLEEYALNLIPFEVRRYVMIEKIDYNSKNREWEVTMYIPTYNIMVSMGKMLAGEPEFQVENLIMQINNEKTRIAIISGAGQLNSDNLSTYILNAIITKAEFVALTHYIDTYYLLNKQVVD